MIVDRNGNPAVVAGMIEPLKIGESIAGQYLRAQATVATINELVAAVNDLSRQVNAMRQTLTAEPALKADYTTDPRMPGGVE